MRKAILLLTISVAALLPLRAQVVISQVYGGGGNAGAQYRNDFIELFNRGTSAVSLTGWSVQYASAAGTGNFVATALSGTLQPGQYYLVQEAAGTTMPPPPVLPTPDATGSIAMAAGAGKVALVSQAAVLTCNGNAVTTPCSSAQLALIVDLVGYGTGASGATFFEGAGAAPTITNTTADFRSNAGCTDTNNNGADFATGAPAPRNTATALNSCTGLNISISNVSEVEGNTGSSPYTNFVFTVSLSNPATGDVTFKINTQPSGTNPATSGVDYVALVDVAGSIPATQQQTQITVQVVGDTTGGEPNETFQVVLSNVVNASPTSVTGTGTILEDDLCDTPATPTSAIQGSQATSSMVGSAVDVKAIVIGDFRGGSKLSGFYVQEEDSDNDGSPLTSEGIFVFDGAFGIDVNPGDKIHLRGKVAEFGTASKLTEINNVTNLAVCSSGNSVTPAVITLPLANAIDWERYEGMLVTFSQPLVATGNFTLGRFGEVDLALNRLPTPTHVVLPGAPAVAQEGLNTRSRIVLDDDQDIQDVFPTLYPQGGLTASNTLRPGDTISGQSSGVAPFVAIVDDAFGRYGLRPAQPLYFVHQNPRPAVPAVAGRFRVAAFNVLNFFTTLDAGSNQCGPTLIDCRGANTAEEFTRQRDKIVAAISALNPDIAGLTELENNPSASLQSLVDGLNAATSPGKFAFINTGFIGTDAIKVGFIYQPLRVMPVGTFKVLDSSVDPRAIDIRNRPALAQSFVPVGSQQPAAEWFTVVINHFKSKGSDCNAALPGVLASDPDIGDGQGNCNQSRLSMAHALTDWLATNPTGNPAPAGDRSILVMGDLNAYRMEDPVTYLQTQGYTDLINKFVGPGAYSYQFDGESGYLDHGLANPSLKRRVQGAGEWHINSDEPIILDYNTEFKSAAALVAYYDAGPYRSSDHDPLVVVFNPLLGDFNDDGVLDASDRTALLGARGQSGSQMVDPRMDMDGDGTITQNDFLIWQDYFTSWKRGRR